MFPLLTFFANVFLVTGRRSRGAMANCDRAGAVMSLRYCLLLWQYLPNGKQHNGKLQAKLLDSFYITFSLGITFACLY